jgi:phage replication O-like protein O
MANPQLENGYTKICNELLSAIYERVNNGDWCKIILFTMRITYGFNRKLVKSNYKSYATAVRIAKDRIELLLSELYLRKILRFEQLSKDFFWIGLNKNYEEWHLEPYVSLNKEMRDIPAAIFQ